MVLKVISGRMLPIGADLGSAAVKLVQLRQCEKDFELVASGSLAIPPDRRANLQSKLQFISQGIRSILKSCSFRTRQCILSLPAADTFVRHVKLPVMPQELIPDALPGELEDKLPFPAEDAVIRHVVVGETRGESEPSQELIVVAVSRATMNAYLAMARQARLDVVGVNVEPCAIVECFARLFQRSTDKNRTILFVDLGSCSTQAVLARGGQIMFARNLPSGADSLDSAVAKGMNIAVDEARTLRRDILSGEKTGAATEELYRMLDGQLRTMADELTQCLRYYESVFRNSSVERAVFVGGGAYDKRLCQSLAQRLNLSAQIGDPLVGLKCAGGATLTPGVDRRAPQPNWAVAVGLSLGAAQN